MMLNSYFKRSPFADKETESTLSKQGIDTRNYKSIVDTTRSKIKGIQDQHSKELEGLE